MSFDNVKYRYALDENGIVVDVSSDSVDKGKDYICLSCHKVLRAVRGDVRQHHFRHKVQADCSTETYLHNLAKRIFAQTYQECLDNNRPYTICCQVPVRCTACNGRGPCEVGHQIQSYDLTKHFRNIEIETHNEGFVPDILLSSNSNPLYIEIAVTHFIEEKKTSSGIRIVEIHINDENDIDLITSCQLSEEDHRIRIANFRKAPVDRDLAHQCPKTVDCFVVYPSGKCILRSVPAPEFDGLVDKGIHIEKVARLGRASFQEEFVNQLERTFQKGLPVRNCWICSFHRLRFQIFQSFCPLKKTVIDNSNQAVDCGKYHQIKKLPDCGLIKDAQNRLIEAQARRVKERQQSQASAQKVAQEGKQDLAHDFFARLREVAPEVQNEEYSSQHQQASPPLVPPNVHIAIQERLKSGKKATCVFCGAVLEEESNDWWWFKAEKGECKCKPCLQKGFS